MDINEIDQANILRQESDVRRCIGKLSYRMAQAGRGIDSKDVALLTKMLALGNNSTQTDVKIVHNFGDVHNGSPIRGLVVTPNDEF